MHDVMTIGSATVDILMKSPDFHLQPTEGGVLLCQNYGGKLDISDFFMQSGGAGTNTAVGFSRLGFQTAAVVEIGKDALAQMVLDDLQREHVDTQYVVAEKLEQTAVSTILISAEGGRSILTHRGASAMLEPRDLPWEGLLHTRWVHLSNTGGHPELLSQLFDHLRPTLVGLSWNPGKKELELLRDEKLTIGKIVCDILIMNDEEWKLIESIQKKLRDQIPMIVVTAGKEGGILYRREYEYAFSARKVEAIQETGAGDAFSVGFVGAHLIGRTPEECCQWGIQNATSVVMKMGAKTGLLHRRDFEFGLLSPEEELAQQKREI